MPPAPRGQPQIEVTFEIDSNGILNVGAEDKATGKAEKITITNDKGRLTEEQIEKMIKEAEQFADEDKKVKERVDAKNAFDGYLHSMRSAVEGSGEHKGLSEKLDFEHKELEVICAPIISEYYGAGGGGSGGEGGEGDKD